MDFRIGTTDAQVFALLLDADDLAPTPRDLAEAPEGARREAFLRRRAATRRLVAQRLGVAASEVEIGHDPQGAPRLLERRKRRYFSLSPAARIFAPSRSDRARLASTSSRWSPRRSPSGARCIASEAARLRALPQDAQSEAFLRLWTAKEAYLKALGTGFSREPATIAVDFDFRLFVEGAEVALAAGEWRTVELGGRKYIVACIVNSSDA